MATHTSMAPHRTKQNEKRKLIQNAAHTRTIDFVASARRAPSESYGSHSGLHSLRTVSRTSSLLGEARHVQSFGLDGANGAQCIGKGSKLFRTRFRRLQAHEDGGFGCFYERGQFPRVKLKNCILKLRLPLRELPSGDGGKRICRHSCLHQQSTARRYESRIAVTEPSGS